MGDLTDVMSRPLERLRHALNAGAATQLGIGPMSRHCVDATIELANELQAPLMLIASRRQIECEEQGGGYVGGWTTETFARYVRERDTGGYVVLCRDHGGPWQNYPEVERRMPLRDAMASALQSLHVDIRSGFDIIHLDPSIDIHDAHLTQAATLERLFELYDGCMEVVAQEGAQIAVEVGSEEQTGFDQDLDVLAHALEETRRFCDENAFPSPMFVVAQTGTLVKEMVNVGTFDDPFRKSGAVPAEILVPRLLDTCDKHSIRLKEHNADYLSDEALRWHPRLGIHAANIAPEFGVAQTRHLFELCGTLGLKREADRFAELAYASGKWKKWMLPESTASDFDRAVIAGHYVFNDDRFLDVFECIRMACAARGTDLDRSIRDAIKQSILRITSAFNLGRGESA